MSATTDSPAAPDPALPEPGSRVLVHGLGRFGGGREAVRYLARRGCFVRVADGSRDQTLQEVRASFGSNADIDWQLGREDEDLLDSIDIVVTSPAVPESHALLQAARRRELPITQEVELFLAAYPGRVVGITGTNGKSSTATLLHRALQTAGCDALLGGNIGRSLLADQAEWRSGQIAVLELSSFQLERLHPRRRLQGALFTRVLRDHIDRHGTLQAYHAAKARLAAAASDFVVSAADDPVVNDYQTGALHRGYFTSGTPGPGSAGIERDYVMLRLGREPAVPIVHRSALRLLGEFQLENVLAASLCAGLLGAEPHSIGLAMATAVPLPFRLQLLHTLDSVRIYDNGVSTEVGSTQLALTTLSRLGGRVHWLGGGKSKEGDYGTVARAIAPLVASAHVFGTAALPMAAAMAETAECPATTTHESLRDACTAALAAAQPGDAVLFSPAFASFDQYPNFRLRALEFHTLLRERRTAAALES